MFRQMRESNSVLVGLIDFAQEGEMAPLVTQHDVDLRMPNTFGVTMLALKGLNVRREQLELGSQQTGMVYSESIDQLGSCLDYVTRSSDPGIDGLSWILRFPSEYMDLLQDREPLALIILAHYCVVMYHLREQWWMGDLGVRILREVCGLLGRDRLAMINWAIDATGICSTEDLQ